MSKKIIQTPVHIKVGGIKTLEYLIKEINKLAKQAKFSIDKDWFMVYALIGTEGDYRGFKVIRIPTSEIFNYSGDGILKWVTLDLKHWTSGLIFLEGEGKMVLSHLVDDESVFNIEIMDNKLSLSYSCDSPALIKDISWEEVENKLAITSCNIEIEIVGETISKVKRLMKMSEDEIIFLKLKDTSAYLGTSLWSLNIGDIPKQDNYSEFMLRGKYISSISSKSDNIRLSFYDDRVAVKDNSIIPSLYLFPLELLDI